MAITDNLTDFLTDVADAIREKDGTTDKINPQDFADRIRALPVRGEVDHEWHIFYDDTQPAELYGGTWEELPQGTFIMAAGSGGTAGQTGGNADAVVVDHAHTLEQDGWNTSSPYIGQGETGRRVVLQTITDASQSYNTVTVYTSHRGESGTGKNLPPYRTEHIWRKVA